MKQHENIINAGISRILIEMSQSNLFTVTNCAYAVFANTLQKGPTVMNYLNHVDDKLNKLIVFVIIMYGVQHKVIPKIIVCSLLSKHL